MRLIGIRKLNCSFLLKRFSSFKDRAVKFCFTIGEMLKFIPKLLGLHDLIPPLKAGLLSSIFVNFERFIFCKNDESLHRFSPPLKGVGGMLSRYLPDFSVLTPKNIPLAPFKGGIITCKPQLSEKNFNILPLAKQNLTALLQRGRTSYKIRKLVENFNVLKFAKTELNSPTFNGGITPCYLQTSEKTLTFLSLAKQNLIALPSKGELHHTVFKLQKKL